MAIIRVPAPSPQAFRKNRPISDLVKSQIRHFQHLEHKLQLNLPTKFSPQDLTTEAAAAQYISEMTTALRGPAVEVPPAIPAASRQKPDTTPATRPRPKAARHPRETSAAAAAAPKARKTKKRVIKKHPGKKS
jgi:hypothetical protein